MQNTAGQPRHKRNKREEPLASTGRYCTVVHERRLSVYGYIALAKMEREAAHDAQRRPKDDRARLVGSGAGTQNAKEEAASYELGKGAAAWVCTGLVGHTSALQRTVALMSGGWDVSTVH